jgi:hypothetical protein
MSKEAHPIPELASSPRVLVASAALQEAYAAYLEHIHAPTADSVRRLAQDFSNAARSPSPAWVIDRTGAKLRFIPVCGEDLVMFGKPCYTPA